MKTVRPHDLITAKDLGELAAVDADLCVSLYMPTHPSAPESHQDPVRFRNLLEEAEDRMLQQGQKRTGAEHLLQPARDMIADDFFWTHQSEGLAVFLTGDSVRRFRLPVPFEQTIEVAGQFLLTPIISMLRPGHAFYLLAISQNSCRLFRGTQFQVEEVESEELPEDLRSALGPAREANFTFRLHPGGPGGGGMYHRHGDDIKSVDLTAYLRQVAGALKPMLHNQSAPLLFAGVEEIFAHFQDVYGEQGLIAEQVAGNPDKMTAEQLHQKAWPIVEKHNREQSAQVWENYHGAQNLDRATNDLTVILSACRDGLVETLLIADGTRHLGRFDPKTRQILMDGDSAETLDVLNLAAVAALRTGANVTAVPPSSIPDKASAAAILRSPVTAIQVPGVKS